MTASLLPFHFRSHTQDDRHADGPGDTPESADAVTLSRGSTPLERLAVPTLLTHRPGGAATGSTQERPVLGRFAQG